MFHIGGIGWAFLGLWNGATTILVGEFVPAAVLELLERERVTNAVFVPTMLQVLAAVPGAGERDYSALRSIAYGASPITTPVLKAALRTFRCALFGIYGLTETTGAARPARRGRPRSGRPARAPPALGGTTVSRGSSCGSSIRRPAPTAATGEVGEVWLRAPNVMAGYFKRPGGDGGGADARTAGCEPATAAISTRTATSS